MLAQALAVLVGLLSLVTSLPTESSILEGRDNSQSYLSLNFHKTHSNGTAKSKRGGDEPVLIRNNFAQSLYSLDLQIGSNKQPVTVLVDTGSSDLVIVETGAVCTLFPSCHNWGTYEPTTSASSKRLQVFGITYLGGQSSAGYYYLDDITWNGGPTLKQAQFAVVNKTQSSNGIMGIGLNATETPLTDGHPKDKDQLYANFPWVLKDQGFINKAAYSMYLNSPNATDGTLLFGGIDKAKYDGDLLTLPGTLKQRLAIKVDSVTVNGTTVPMDVGVVLDTGYQWSYLPKPITDFISKSVVGGWNSDGSWILNCDQPDDQYVTFNFGGGQKSIDVPFSYLVTPGTRTPNTDWCDGLDFSGNGSDINNEPTFGVDILRAFYIVYDIEENAMSIAQAKYTSDSDIVPIE